MKKICFLLLMGMLMVNPFRISAQRIITKEIAQSRIDELNQKGKDSFILIEKEGQKQENGDVITCSICHCDSLPGYSKDDFRTFNKRYGLKIKSGSELNPVFENIVPWENNTYLIKYFKTSTGSETDESWLALVDRNLHVIRVYEGEWTFEETFHVKKNGKYGVVSAIAEEFIPFVYDTITDPSASEEVLNDDFESYSKTYAAKKDGKWGIISTQEKTVIDFKYDYLSNLNHGNAIAEKNHKWGIISKTDSIVVPFQFDSIVKDGDEFFVMKGKKWGFMSYDYQYKNMQFPFDEMISEYQDFGRVGQKWYRIGGGKILDPNEFFDGVLPRDNDYGPFVCLRKNGLIAVYKCDEGKLETDYVYSKVLDVLYERGQDRDSEGNLLMDYPVYRFKMIQGGKEVEFTIRN